MTNEGWDDGNRAETVKQYYVYIMASRRNGTLYIGMTNNLCRRAYQHKQKETDGFTKEYDVTRLVYCETCDDVRDAIAREKQLKAWKRRWKLELIEELNPTWRDMYDDLMA
jgi:putative endonuclease